MIASKEWGNLLVPSSTAQCLCPISVTLQFSLLLSLKICKRSRSVTQIRPESGQIRGRAIAAKIYKHAEEMLLVQLCSKPLERNSWCNDLANCKDQSQSAFSTSSSSLVTYGSQ